MVALQRATRLPACLSLQFIHAHSPCSSFLLTICSCPDMHPIVLLLPGQQVESTTLVCRWSIRRVYPTRLRFILHTCMIPWYRVHTVHTYGPASYIMYYPTYYLPFPNSHQNALQCPRWYQWTFEPVSGSASTNLRLAR